MIVMAMETGGRWSEESVAVLRELSSCLFLSWSHVGPQVDANAHCPVCHSFRSFVGGASTSHFVMPHGREDPSLG